MASGQFVLGGELIKIAYMTFMYLGLTAAWNYVSGYTGYVSFGPHMFVGLGVYALVAFINIAGMSWQVGLLAAGAFGLVISGVLGVVLMRISGIYFGIATLLVAEGLRYGVLWEQNLTGFLGGSEGASIPIIGSQEAYILFGSLALIAIIITFETARTDFGLRMLAVREDEEVLGTIGVQSLKYKVFPFMIHGMLTAMIGAVFGLSLGFAFPSAMFSIDITVTLVLLAILGGLGTVWGPLIGAAIVIPLQEAFWVQFPDLFIILYGLALVALIIFMPEGVINKLKDNGYLPESRGI
jgi:branched-chain amino acid transport system permease protein